jgi:serine/threonine protein kinase
MWAYEGRYTLSSHLRSPTYPRALGGALYGAAEELDAFEDPELAVAQTVMRQVLEALRQMHGAGLVHRDVKPLNLVLDEARRCFKLIDLGACADLRTGKNYAPDETILDPKYSPPEEFLMPIDEAPDLAAASAPVALALGASAWARYQPDRFDMYSAGIIFMQLAVPSLRSDRGLKAFNEALKAAGHDLAAWRAAAALPLVQTAVLDANDDSGWELATALLQARPPNWADAVMPTRSRPSADEALSFRFFATRARKRAPGSKYSTALAGQRALARLETQMMEQTKAVRLLPRPRSSMRALAVTCACLKQRITCDDACGLCVGEQHEVQG